ncbi:MAG: carboxyl transferase [Lachnospiraceae bacterium]|nr:carboxyl transferase [Lachnospiraceae bacterium]
MSADSKARARIVSLLDENSFVETGANVRARATDFSLKQKDAPSDGVITGYGVLCGSPVFVYSQDSSVLGGSLGEMHAAKIAAVYDKAVQMGVPVIGMLDSSGLRVEESTDALEGLGKVYAAAVRASGVVPVVTAVFGNCGGGLSFLTQLSDFTAVDCTSGHLFVNSPDAVKGNYEEKCDTSGADFQSGEAGNVDFCGETGEVISWIRDLMTILPVNNEDDTYLEGTDDLNRQLTGINEKDSLLTLINMADDSLFVETRAGFGKNMVTGLMRIAGQAVGVFANRSVAYDESGAEKENFGTKLSFKGCMKASRLVRFCDAFGLPIISLTNVTGFGNCSCNERNLAREAARLMSDLASATVPKINVVTGKAYGSAYVAMNSNGLGADITFAWPSAEIGTMDPKDAAAVLASDGDKAEMEKKYKELQANVASASARGYVDSVIEPGETRQYLAGALGMLSSKAIAVEDRKRCSF